MPLISQVQYASEIYKTLLEEGCFATIEGNNTFKALKKKVIKMAAEAGGKSESSNNLAIAYQQISSRDKTSGNAIVSLENAQNVPNGSILLTFLAETHNLPVDTQRANQYLAANNNMNIPITCMVLERGLDYNLPQFGGTTIREENLGTTAGLAAQQWGLGLDMKTRSMLVAGYLVLYMINTDSAVPHPHIAVFFGENHWDIFAYIKQIINDSYIALKERNIQCTLAPSGKGKENLLGKLK